MKVRKKPVVVEAEQFFSAKLTDLSPEFSSIILWDTSTPPQPFIQSLEGPHHVADGDWIIKGVKGEFYACKPDIFAMTYDVAE